jgi:hypothetical protein
MPPYCITDGADLYLMNLPEIAMELQLNSKYIDVPANHRSLYFDQ